MEELLFSGALDELMELCEANGRALILTDPGRIFTVDLTGGTDMHEFRTPEEAIAWERGYQR